MDEASGTASSRESLLRSDDRVLRERLHELIPRVRALVRYFVRSDDIEDLTHDALITMMERLYTYRGEGRFEAWVDGVCLRVVMRALSRKRARHRREGELIDDELGLIFATSPTSAYSSWERAAKALDDLSGPQRDALIMHFVLGMTVAEIAEDLAVPQETVRSRMRVGMGRIRSLLGVPDA